MANISRRKSGSFSIRVSNGMKDGKQVFVNKTYHPLPGSSEKTARRGAEQFAAMLEQLVHSGACIDGMDAAGIKRKKKEATVREFSEDYLKSIALHLSPNTCRTYEKIVKQLILPSFGDLPVAEINETHMQAFVDFLCTPDACLKGDGGMLSAATVRRYATVLSSLLTAAWRKKLIPKKPLADAYIVYPKKAMPELEVYDEQESARFLSALKEEPIRTQALLTLALTTGMRRAELVALKWSDLDTAHGLISVRRSAYKPKGGEQKTKLPKSLSSIRQVPLLPMAKEILESWREAQAEEKTCAGGKWREEDYIFTDALGKMISLYLPTTLCSDFEKRHGLRHLKLHGLRHTCGTLMVGNGVDLQTVKSLLGHADWETTERYVHTLNDRLCKA